MITAHQIGYTISMEGKDSWQVVDATTLKELPGEFATATDKEIHEAMQKAASAFHTYRNLPGSTRARFLRAIADEIEALGDKLVERMTQESALPPARVRNERGRTTAQLRMFADYLEEGSWVDAVIEKGDPDRSPPKPDLRRMLHPIGPVIVFTAANFPLAYSTAGGDTASALAAGCPVIVKAHEAHAGTNALVAEAVVKAAELTHMPEGVFSTLYAKEHGVGSQLVEHPLTAGVGFTGSLRGGRALFDIAAKRDTPIPVFAEMSSINPIYILPGKLHADPEGLAQQIATSVNTGAGQFCTCPGLLIMLDDGSIADFIEKLKPAFAGFDPLTMLNAGIQKNYDRKKSEMLSSDAIATEYAVENSLEGKAKAGPAVASVSATDFLAKEEMQDEVFGPFTMVIKCRDLADMKAVAHAIHGQLTSTVHATESELSECGELFDILREKAGRLIYNGVPTGVEVNMAQVHGGPYPATTDGRFTAVGHSAIRRWVRPVAYQDCPDTLLPAALKEENVLGIWRTVDGEFKR